jgi:hypothetical protein
MQRQWRLFASALTFVSFAAFAATPSSLATADADQAGECGIGSWIGTISFEAPPGAPPLVGQVNINRDGTITGTDGGVHGSQVELPPALSALAVDLGDYFGSWARIGGSNRSAGTIKRLLFAGPNTPTAIYGPFVLGQNIGLGTLSEDVTCAHTSSGDAIAGPWTFQFYSFFLNKVVITNRGTFSFSRVAIEPLAP